MKTYKNILYIFKLYVSGHNYFFIFCQADHFDY